MADDGDSPPDTNESPGGDGSDEGSGDGGITDKDPDIYFPIYVMTGIFGGMFIFFPLLVRKGPNQGLIRTCIWIGTFAMWLFWFTVYVAQMNPLMGPRIKNTTLAWIAHSWGKRAKKPPSFTTPSVDEEATTTVTTPQEGEGSDGEAGL